MEARPLGPLAQLTEGSGRKDGITPNSAVKPTNSRGQCGILESRRRPTLKFQKEFCTSALRYAKPELAIAAPLPAARLEALTRRLRDGRVPHCPSLSNPTAESGFTSML
jgi:hypothetical protein